VKCQSRIFIAHLSEFAFSEPKQLDIGDCPACLSAFMRRREHPDFAEEVSRFQYVIDFLQAHLSADKHIDAIGMIASLEKFSPQFSMSLSS
jgi:hypothetical protein